ncbi:MAG: hypothetical protein QM736_06565 [Vicinamibacterales bacterium]
MYIRVCRTAVALGKPGVCKLEAKVAALRFLAQGIQVLDGCVAELAGTEELIAALLVEGGVLAGAAADDECGDQRQRKESSGHQERHDGKLREQSNGREKLPSIGPAA